MSYVFASVVAAEMERYLNLLREAGRYIYQIQSSLRSLDKYMVNNVLTQRTLEAKVISSWIKTRNVGSVTKSHDISNVKGFIKYLVSLGIEANSPEALKAKSNYTPYIFSDDEIKRIIATDNFEAGRLLTRSAKVFPILLCVFYGCGLRLGEGVRFTEETLTLKTAFNNQGS